MGLSLTLTIGMVAFGLSSIIDFNAILLALVLGIIVGNVTKLPDSFESGIKLSSGKLLELAIVFMAFSIDYVSLLSLGWSTILIIVISVVIVLVATLFLSEKMKCPSQAGLLVGFGTAICGSSAVAALAPSIGSDKSDMGISMAVINLYGLLGMLSIPAITQGFLSDPELSVLLGASLHSVGNVAGAGFALSDTIGELAVTVKLGRVALLTPALIIFTIFIGPEAKGESLKSKLKLPWYLGLFILISIVASVVTIPAEVKTIAASSSSFLLALAMAAIGLKVSFSTLVSSGKKGLIFGALLFAIQLIAIGIMMWIFA